MHSVVIIAIVFGSIIITFAIIPATILFAIKMFKGRGTGRQGLADEETKMIQPKEASMSVMVGKEAPDFEAAAFHEGGFKNIRLSEFRGKWVMLCFYPGDFTFV